MAERQEITGAVPEHESREVFRFYGDRVGSDGNSGDDVNDLDDDGFAIGQRPWRPLIAPQACAC